MTQKVRLLTLLLVPGLHEHHLFVFVPRSVGSVGAGDAPRPRGGWLDTPACPTTPATVLHSGGGTLLRPFAAALGSPQTLTTWSRPSRCRTITLYISFLSLRSLSLSPFLSFLLFYFFFTLRFIFDTRSPPSLRFLSRNIGPISLREKGYSSVGRRNTGDPDWRTSKQRPNNRDARLVAFRSLLPPL